MTVARRPYGPTVNLDLTPQTHRKHAKRRTKQQARGRKLDYAITETLRRHPGLTRGEIHEHLTTDRVRVSLQNVITAVEKLFYEGRITYELEGKPAAQVYRLNENYYFQ